MRVVLPALLALLASIGFWCAAHLCPSGVAAEVIQDDRPLPDEPLPLLIPLPLEPVHRVAVVSASADTEEGEDSLSPDEMTAVLRGRVGVDRGLLPADVSVTVLPMDSPASDAGFADETLSTTAGRDGAFAVAVGPGAYQLVFRSPGFVPASLDGLKVRAGEEVRGLNATLEAGERVAGRVISAEEAEPLSDHLVTLEGHGFAFHTRTDERGEFAFEGVPPTWQEQPTQFQARAFDASTGSDERAVRAGETGLTLVLARRGHLRGEVLDPQGRPVPEAQLFVATPDPLEGLVAHDPYGLADGESIVVGGFSTCGPFPECRALGRTDKRGHFELEVAEVSGLQLAAWAPGMRAGPVGVSPHQADLRLTMAPPLTVTVRLERVSPNAPRRAWVRATAHAAAVDLFAYQQAWADEQGIAALELWPGVPATLTGSRGWRVVATAALPTDVRLGAPEPLQDIIY